MTISTDDYATVRWPDEGSVLQDVIPFTLK